MRLGCHQTLCLNCGKPAVQALGYCVLCGMPLSDKTVVAVPAKPKTVTVTFPVYIRMAQIPIAA